MTKRREFLQLGLLVCSGNFFPRTSLAGSSPASGQGMAPVQSILQDLRYPAAADYLHGLQGHLARATSIAPWHFTIKGIDREFTRRWFGVWQQAEGLSLAGTTGADVLFCLEQLGRDKGLRVLWRSCHGKHEGDNGTQALYSWILAGAPTRNSQHFFQTAEFA